MLTSFSEDKLHKAPSFVGSSVEARVGGLSTAPASCIFQRITCSYLFFSENPRATRIGLIPKRALAHQEDSIVYNIQSTERHTLDSNRRIYWRTIH